MKDVQIGVLLPIFLFFMLVVGIVIIYREEIEKMEFFAKLQTTAIPATLIDVFTVSDPPIIPIADLSPTSSSITSTAVPRRPLSLGGGRIVDSSLRAVPVSEVPQNSVSLHTIASGLNDYYARAFIEEASNLYTPSPHAGTVLFLDRVTSLKERDPNREYFILLVSDLVSNPVSITGWKVFDRQKKISYIFPKGVKMLGSDEISSPITVYPGGIVIVSSGRSPVGFSFQVNKCSGYRSQFKNFIPTIKTACTDPIQEFTSYEGVSFSDDVCYAAVSSLRPCVGVTRIPSGVTKECRYFLEHVMTEDGCVSRHRNDSDFLTGEWRLFLRSEDELWRNYDNVLYLLDENDLLVATLIYR